MATAKKQSGAGDFEPTVLSLERRIPFGDRALEWTINAEGGGRNLLYRAEPNGSKVRNQGGIVDNFDIAVDGIQAEWWTIAPPTVYLVPPGTRGELV